MAFFLGNTAIYLLVSFGGGRDLEADLRRLIPVDVELRFSEYHRQHHEGDSRVVVPETESSAFRFPLYQFLASPSLEEAVSRMLSTTRSPNPSTLEFWKEKLIAFASSKAQQAFDAGREGVKMVVAIHIYPASWGSAEEMTTEAPAASIEGLEKVTYDRVGDELFKGHGCAICLEEFDVAMEVSRMPCMHVFHGDCLARWLERNPNCPYCRYKMLASSPL